MAIHTTGQELESRQVLVDGVFHTATYDLGPIHLLLSVGTHTIQVAASYGSFDDGCASNIVEVEIADPPVLELNLDDYTDLSCPGAADGSVELSFSGGAKPYEIVVYTSIRTAFSISNYNANSLSLGNLETICVPCGEGTYFASITDRNGCEKTVEFVINEPSPVNIIVTSSTPPTSCLENNGTISLSATGGTPPYEFALNSMNFFAETTFGNALPENTIYARDAQGCIVSITSTLASNPTPPLAVSTPTVLQDDYSFCGASLEVQRLPYQVLRTADG